MRSKPFLLIILHLLFLYPVAAQDAMPTKEETVNYINRKLQEVKDRGSAYYDDRWMSISFKLAGNQIEFLVIDRDDRAAYNHHSFNPRDIVKTEFRYKPGEDMAEVVIFTVKGGVKIRPVDRYGNDSKDYKTYFGEAIIFRYLATVPGNKEKIHKAFLHLRDLAKAEDELF
jgi:hypothetical protein